MASLTQSRSSRNALACALWFAFALLPQSACVWGGLGTGPDPPKVTAPPASTPLVLDRRTGGRTDCSAGECMRRYRIEIEGRGRLRVAIDTDLEDGDLVRAILEDPVGNVLARETVDEPGRQIVLEGAAQPGFYTVLLQSGSGDTPYSLLATLDSSGPKQTTVLEQEVAQDQRNERPQRPPQTGTSVAPDLTVPDDLKKRASEAGFAGNPKIDFASYRTYTFARDPQHMLDAQPGAYVGNPFLDQEIERAIRSVLANRNYRLTGPDEAEFLVNYHTGRSSQAYYVWSGQVFSYNYTSMYDTWIGYPGFGGGVLRTDMYTQGTLVIDIIDLETNALVWHGWATKTTGWVDQKELVREAVEEILKKFPQT